MIYFAQAIEGGPIKIGCSGNVPARIKQLRSYYGRPLALLATMKGGEAEERAIHERFAEHRLGRTEQFRPVAEIMEFIRRPLLVSPNPDAVEVMNGGFLPRWGRTARYHFSCTPQYRDWLNAFAAAEKKYVPELIEKAMETYAAIQRYTPPPPTRTRETP